MSALRTGRVDLCVGMQRSGNAKRVPGTVGKVGLSVRAHVEGSLNSREGTRHQDVVSSGSEKKCMPMMKFFVGRNNFLRRECEAGRRILHGGRARRLCEIAIDECTNFPEKVFSESRHDCQLR